MKTKVFFFLSLALAMLSMYSCEYEPDLMVTPPDVAVKQYVFKANAAIVNDTVYGSTVNPILFFVEKNDSIVSIQIDYGDGGTASGTEVIHQYKTDGVYQLSLVVVSTNTTIKRIVKIGSPAVVTSKTIVQLSGNTIGDSASINLLCLKSKIFNNTAKGTYYLKGDMYHWRAIAPVDTNFIYNGASYLQFNFKVKNDVWISFGYYKAISGAEQWSYDPANEYWDTTKGLYKFYVANSKIYSTQLSSTIPGTCGDVANSTSGSCFRLDYETNGANPDSLIIYANRNYLSGDSTKFGIGYTVDGSVTAIKKARFIKGYIYCKVPVSTSSSLRFRSYKDISSLTTGNMNTSIFWDANINDCYLNLAGTIQKVSGVNKSSYNLPAVTLANGQKLYFN
jgi:hypothetical protein